jgi:MFS-type transporter involved in bile tolerance (Atg22 family)
MFLTYLAIVSTYIPPILTAIREEVAKQETAQAGASQGSESKGGASPSVKPGPAESGPDFEHMTGGQKFVAAATAIAVLLAIALVAPFLAGFENIMGIVIIGIGLYEAWKINKRHVLEITGPHMVGAAPQPADAGGTGPNA